MFDRLTVIDTDPASEKAKEFNQQLEELERQNKNKRQS